jgi:TonB family protein
MKLVSGTSTLAVILSVAICSANAQTAAQDMPTSSQPSSSQEKELMHVCSSKFAQPCATPPKVTSADDPVYSGKARKKKLEGVVVLATVIGVDGKAHDIRVERSLGMGLDEEAVKAVKRWRFKPAMYVGKPVPVLMNLEIAFHLF